MTFLQSDAVRTQNDVGARLFTAIAFITMAAMLARLRSSISAPAPHRSPCARVRPITRQPGCTMAVPTYRGSMVRRVRSARAVRRCYPDLVPAELRAADRGPGARLGEHRRREPHADAGADRQRQDARRVPVVHRSARAAGARFGWHA